MFIKIFIIQFNLIHCFVIQFWYRHSIVFVNQCLYLLAVRTQLVEHCTVNCHLLHVSVVFGHHQADFTTYIHGKEYRVAGFPFEVNILKYIKFRPLLPKRERKNIQ